MNKKMKEFARVLLCFAMPIAMFACKKTDDTSSTNQTASNTTQSSTSVNVLTFAATVSSTLIIKSDSTLWVLGKNDFGQTSDASTVPKQIGTRKYKTIAATTNHFFVLAADGTLWACGHNSHGQLGDGTTTDVNTLKQIGTQKYKAIATTIWHTLALAEDGTLWTCGTNDCGELGNGIISRDDVLSLTQIGTQKYKAIAASTSYSLALAEDGTLWG